MADDVTRYQPMSSERRAELLDLCEKATPGPWHFIPSGVLIGAGKGKPCVLTWSNANGWETCGPDGMLHPVCEYPADVLFIEDSRQALPELLAENERLTRALEQACEVGDIAPVFDEGYILRRNPSSRHRPDRYPELTAYLKEKQS